MDVLALLGGFAVVYGMETAVEQPKKLDADGHRYGGRRSQHVPRTTTLAQKTSDSRHIVIDRDLLRAQGMLGTSRGLYGSDAEILSNVTQPGVSPQGFAVSMNDMMHQRVYTNAVNMMRQNRTPLIYQGSYGGQGLTMDASPEAVQRLQDRVDAMRLAHGTSPSDILQEGRILNKVGGEGFMALQRLRAGKESGFTQMTYG